MSLQRSLPPQSVDRQICVFAGANFGNHREFTEQAQILGERIGASGFDLVFGGFNTGLMGVLAKAARARGSKTIGILPHPADDHYLRNPQIANSVKNNDSMVGTPSLDMRKKTMLSMSAATVALAGGMGTLDEIITTLERARSTAKVGELSKLVVVNTLGFYDGLKMQLDRMHTGGLIRPTADDCIYFAADANDAMDFVTRQLVFAR